MNLTLWPRFSPLHKREEPSLSSQVSGFNAAVQWSPGLVTGTMHALGRRYSLTIFLGKQEGENGLENYVSFSRDYLRRYCTSVTYSFWFIKGSILATAEHKMYSRVCMHSIHLYSGSLAAVLRPWLSLMIQTQSLSRQSFLSNLCMLNT